MTVLQGYISKPSAILIYCCLLVLAIPIAFELMGSQALAMFLVFLFLFIGPSQGKVYKVGDSSGWTIIGHVNYTAWASSKNFHVGDTIVFEYNKTFHNVLEVKESDYSACTTSSSLASFTSGNDSIPIKQAGHQYFICGFPGHCAGGQKVDIMVRKLATSSAAPPLSSTTGAPPSSSPTSPNNAALESHKALHYFSLLVVFVSTFVLV